MSIVHPFSILPAVAHSLILVSLTCLHLYMHACQVNMIHLLLNCLGSSNVGVIIGGVVGVLLSVVIVIIVIAIVVISLHLRYNKGITIVTLSILFPHY